MVIDVGFLYAAGSLFLAVMEDYGASRAGAAVLQSTLLGVTLGAGIVTGSVVKRYGAKKSGLVGTCLATVGLTTSFFATSITYLVASLGIVTAAGFSILFISCSTATGDHFKGKKIVIILSALSTGSGVGGMIYPYILIYLNNEFGLRGTLLCVGAMVANSFPCCLLWTNVSTNNRHGSQKKSNKISHCQDNLQNDRNVVIFNLDESNTKGNVINKPETQPLGSVTRINKRKLSIDVFNDDDKISCTEGESRETQTRAITVVENQQITSGSNFDSGTEMVSAIDSVKALVRNKSFICFTASLALSYSTICIVLIFIVDLFTDKGLTESDASMGLFILNLFSIFGRLCPGFIIQIPRFPTIGVPLIASCIGFHSMAGVILIESFAGTLAMCALIGLSLGIFVTMFTAAPARLFGHEYLPTAIGILLTSAGIGNPIAASISGMIRDRTNSYQIPFYSVAACLAVSCCLYCVAQLFHKREKQIHRRRASVFYITRF